MLLDLQWSLPQQGSITLDRLQDGLSLPRSEFAQIQFDIQCRYSSVYKLFCLYINLPANKEGENKTGVDISLYKV